MVTIRIKVIGQYVVVQHFIHVDYIIIGIGYRRTVARHKYRQYTDVHRCGITEARIAIIANGVHKGIQSDESAVGHILIVAFRSQITQRSVAYIHNRDRIHINGISIGVKIIDKYIPRNRCIQYRVVKVISCHRWAVGRLSDRDVNSSRIAKARCSVIADRVNKLIRSDIIAIRSVSK